MKVLFFGKINFNKINVFKIVLNFLDSFMISFISILILFFVFVNIFLFIIKKFNTTYLDKLSNLNVKNIFKNILIGFIVFISIPIISLILSFIKISYLLIIVLLILYMIIIFTSLLIFIVFISSLILFKFLKNKDQSNIINKNKFLNIYFISFLILILFTILLYIPYINIVIILLSTFFGLGNLFYFFYNIYFKK